METIKAKYDVLKFISNIADVAKDSKLDEDIFENLAPELAALSNYLKVSTTQALGVAITFTLNANNDNGSVFEYKKYFDCNPIKVLELQKDFPELVEKGILSISKCALRGRGKSEFARNEYLVSDQIVKSILKNEMPNLSVRPDELDIFEVLEKIYKLSQEREEGVISTSELFKTFKKHLATYAHFPLIKHITQLNFEVEDAYLFILLCWKSLLGEESISLIRTLENIFDRPNKLIHYSQGIICEENALIKRGFVERFEAHFLNNTEIKLTQQSIDFLEKENIKLLNKKGNESNCLILPEMLAKKKLFYNKTEKNQLDLISNSLKDQKFKELQKVRVKSIANRCCCIIPWFTWNRKNGISLSNCKSHR